MSSLTPPVGLCFHSSKAPFQSSVPKLCSKAPFQSSVPKLRSKAPFQSSVPKLRSKATTLPRAGFLPPFYDNADPVKSLHDTSIRTPEPISSLCPCLQRADVPTASVLSFISWLQVLPPAGYILCVLMSMGYQSPSPYLCPPEFPKPAAGRHPAGYGFSSQSPSLRI